MDIDIIVKLLLLFYFNIYHNNIIYRTKIDDEGMASEFVTYFPNIYVEGIYKSEGRLNNFKLKSKGYFNLTFGKGI